MAHASEAVPLISPISSTGSGAGGNDGHFLAAAPCAVRAHRPAPISSPSNTHFRPDITAGLL